MQRICFECSHFQVVCAQPYRELTSGLVAALQTCDEQMDDARCKQASSKLILTPLGAKHILEHCRAPGRPQASCARPMHHLRYAFHAALQLNCCCIGVLALPSKDIQCNLIIGGNELVQLSCLFLIQLELGLQQVNICERDIE